MAKEIEIPVTREMMTDLAVALDKIFNGEAQGHDRKIGFVVLVAEFGKIEGGRCNYISNGERTDMVSLARFEGRYVDHAGAA